MSVYIYQDDALELMGKVEGEDWVQQQDRHPCNEYGFHIYRKAWDELQESEYAGQLTPSSFVDRGDGVIYGDGGYARYCVDKEGRIVLLSWSTRAERIAKAQGVGFDVV